MDRELAEVTIESGDKPIEPDPVKEFLRIAHKRFERAAKAEQETRREALDDLKFRTGDQWPQDIKINRSKDGRPCLEMDQIEKFIRQVCNEERQQRPAIQVNPVGDGADVETAEIQQGLIRHIETQSPADVPRDHAFEMMVSIGFGHYRLTVEEDELTGDLEIYNRRIKNPFTVYSDPDYQMPDCSDRKWLFIITDMPRDEYKAEYPDSEMASLLDFRTVGDNVPDWVTDTDIRVAEYFYVEGKGKDQKVKWAKINAVECLEGGPRDEVEWHGKWIPILTVLGTDLDVNGRRYLAGMVRKLKDPQRQYNYMNSAATEAVALAPKAPFILAEGQAAGYEVFWKQANQRNWPYLVYKQTDVGGKPAPPPQRNSVEPPIQAMMEMVRQANEDLQGAAGIYNPSLGAPSADHSGKAILARQKQADVTNLNWTDNLARTIWFEGKMLLDLIPKIYTETKARRIINPDGTAKTVGITNSRADGMDSEAAQELLQLPKVYDIGVGNYDVTISVGPSYQSKRQEAVASQLALIQAVPQIVGVAGDILVGNMDWPGAKEISKRLKQTLPPQLQDNDGSPEAQLQQLQTQNGQMQGMLQQANQVIQQQHQMLEGKMLQEQTRAQIAQFQEESKQAIVRMQEATKLAVAQINASKDANQGFAEQELKQYQILHEGAHDLALSQQEHQQNMELGQQAAALQPNPNEQGQQSNA